MATILPAESTQHARNGAQKAIAFEHAQRIGGLSRIVDRDIEILKMNLVQLHDGQDEARSSAWERLESAWETVRSELAVVPTVPVAVRVLNWVTGVLGPAISSRTGHVVRWSREPARRAELRAAALKIWRFVNSAALAGAKHVSNGWRGLQGVVRRQAGFLESTWSRFEGKWHTRKGARSQPAKIEASAGAIEVVSPPAYATGLPPPDETPAADLPNCSTDLAQSDSGGAYTPLDEPTASSEEMPFVLKPLPWVLGALSPVISSKTMMHHGSYYSQCIVSANRLSRDHKKLAGKNPLEIVRWAREHARGTELLSTASEAWNHSFYWQCLTPGKKRPSGELCKALDRIFGDYSNFADKFALAGATHVGSGWLWLTANSRKQVKILTTSDTECPEARGLTCLLAIDLWEHAYYLDHQNRRREYLDALIDRRLDWDFAEQRFCLVLQRESHARRKTSFPAGDRKRSLHSKQQRHSKPGRPVVAMRPPVRSRHPGKRPCLD